MKTEKLTLTDCFKYPNAKVKCDLRFFDKYAKGVIEYKNEVATVHSIVVGNKYLAVYSENLDYTENVTVPVSDCKLILRSIDELTDEEKKRLISIDQKERLMDYKTGIYQTDRIDYLRSINIDIDGFLESGKAVKG